MTEDTCTHWEGVYAAKAWTDVSWFRADLASSLAMVAAAGTARSAAVIDVGARAATLVDRLLVDGFAHITALDVSEASLAIAKARLEGNAHAVEWVTANVATWSPPEAAYDLWHDRAVFHFLVDDQDR